MLDCLVNEVNTSFAAVAGCDQRGLRTCSTVSSARIDRRGRRGCWRAGRWAVLAGGTDLYPAHVGRPIGAPLLDITAHRRPARHPARRPRLDDRRDDDLDRRRPRRPAAAVRRAEGGGARGRRRADPEHRHGRRQRVQRLAGRRRHAGAARARRAASSCRARAASASWPSSDFVLGSRRTARAADELVVAFAIPARSGAGALGVRQARRPPLSRRSRSARSRSSSTSTTAGAIADAGVAVGSCSAVRAAPAGARGAPRRRARPTPISPRWLDPADLAPLTPIDDLRGSAAYRRDATATLAPARARRRLWRAASRLERSDDRARPAGDPGRPHRRQRPRARARRRSGPAPRRRACATSSA